MREDKGKYIFGICKVGEKGQIVIPKEARKIFNIYAGDSMIVFGDIKRGGIALVKTDVLSDATESIFGGGEDE